MLDGRRHGSPPSTVASPLARTRFLAAFHNADDRSALEAIAQPARTYRAGTDLVRDGDDTDRLFVLLEGWAYRYKTTRDGGRQIVALIVPGELANLDTLLFGRPDFSVRTLTSVEAAAIPCVDIAGLIDQHVGIGKTLMRLALTENSILGQWALCLGRLSAQQRLAHLLCELGERLYADGAATGTSFDLPLTQEMIADTLGLTPVHVNRTLQHMRSDGLVATSGRTMSLLDVPRLRDMAGYDGVYLRGSPVDWVKPAPAVL